jgi:hypothetical protein
MGASIRCPFGGIAASATIDCFKERPMAISARFLVLAFLAASLGGIPAALAQTPGGTADAPREKACNQVANDHQLAGDTRKAFLQDCLKGKPADLPAAASESCASRAKKADQQKLKGEERKLFMSGCVKRP